MGFICMYSHVQCVCLYECVPCVFVQGLCVLGTVCIVRSVWPDTVCILLHLFVSLCLAFIMDFVLSCHLVHQVLIPQVTERPVPVDQIIDSPHDGGGNEFVNINWIRMCLSSRHPCTREFITHWSNFIYLISIQFSNCAV